jgi:hypothetical protein
MKIHIIIDTRVEGENGEHRSEVWAGDLEILNEKEHLVKISVMAEGELQPIVEIPFAKGIGHYQWIAPDPVIESEEWIEQ